MTGVTAEDVERTARTTTTAQWGVAAVVMVGSAVSAGIGFAHVGQHPAYAAVGVITGLGVDLALASGLIIGRRLRAVGITTTWGTVLLWLTGAMTLCLNSGAAALQDRWVLAVAHAFLPVLLVVLCEAGSEAQLKLHRLARQAIDTERAAREAQLAADRATYEAEQRQIQIERDQAHTRQDNLRTAELANETHQREIADRRDEREQRSRELIASVASVLTLSTSLSHPTTRHKRSPVAVTRQLKSSTTRTVTRGSSGQKSTSATRQAWIKAQLATGNDVTGADVKRRFPDASNCARDVASVKKQITQEQINRRGSVHVVRGN